MYKELEMVAQKRHYGSIYSMIRQLLELFVKHVGQPVDKRSMCISEEIRQMFVELAECEEHVEYEKPKRREPCITVDDMREQTR